MNITEINPTGSTANAGMPSRPEVMGKEDFLSLLIAQLENQDPLNPMDSTDFSAQLAQFSSLEQLTNINENLGYLQSSQSSMNNSQAVGFLGKTITARGNSIIKEEGGSEEIHFEIQDNAAAIVINIYDEYGEFVRTIDSGALDAGEHMIEWDGLDDQGNTAPEGQYFFEVHAVDQNDDMIDIETLTTCIVTGVTYKNGVAYLLSGKKEFLLEDLVRVSAVQ